MTIRELLTGSALARLDAEILIAHAVKKPRSWVLAHDDEECTRDECNEIQANFERRRKGEPLAYITGGKEFYGRNFRVTRDTLIPRPATEALIGLTKKFLENGKAESIEIDSGITGLAVKMREGKPMLIVDVGTGSGCIAITLALEGIGMPMIGVDVSEDALEVAKNNAETLGAANVNFMKEDGASFVNKITEPFLLVSNPPYVPNGETLEKNVADFEPHGALFAGDDGMNVIRPLAQAAAANPHCIGVVLELRTDQVAQTEAVLGRMGR